MFCRDYDVRMLTRSYSASYVTRQCRNILDYSSCTMKQVLCRETYKKKLAVQSTRVTVCQKGSRQVWHITCLQVVLNVDARHDQSTRLTSLCVQTDSTFPSPAPRSRYLRGYPTYWYLSNHDCSHTWLKERTYQPLRSPEENGVAFLFLLTQRDNVLFFICAW